MRRSWLELVNKNNYQRVTKPSKKEKEEICHSASAIALQPICDNQRIQHRPMCNVCIHLASSYV